MRANPLGLIITGLTALAGMAVAVATHWQPLGNFFAKFWQGIKTVFSLGVDGVFSKLQLLAKPLQWLGQQWHKLIQLFHQGHGVKTVKLGHLVQVAPVKTARLSTLPQVAANASQYRQHHVNIHAPITIHAEPGMDEQAIAREVKNALQQHAQDLQSVQRASLYDEAS